MSEEVVVDALVKTEESVAEAPVEEAVEAPVEETPAASEEAPA